MDNSSQIVVVTSADDGYSMPLCVMLRSLFDNAGEASRLQVVVLDGGISERNRRRVESTLGELSSQVRWSSFREVDIPHRPHEPHLSVATSFRFLISDVVGPEINRVIYLDSDLIVTAEIEGLWETSLEGSILAAVVDSGAPSVSHAQGIARYQELGFDSDMKYFNAGVLLIDLEAWRGFEIGAKAIEYLEQYLEGMNLVSQEALNAVVAGRWCELDSKWNQLVNPMPFFNEPSIDQNIKEPTPGVLHFFTACKPWDLEYPHPFKSEFYRYLDRTEWAGWRPQGPSFCSRVAGRVKRIFDNA